MNWSNALWDPWVSHKTDMLICAVSLSCISKYEFLPFIDCIPNILLSSIWINSIKCLPGTQNLGLQASEAASRVTPALQVEHIHLLIFW